MSRALIALALLVATTATAAAQPQRMSIDVQPETASPPTVYLYSFGLGDVVFEKFGHSALCLEYAELDRRDPRQFVCFNYGVTDFSDPTAVIWGFLRSNQKFWVEPVPQREILHYYSRFEDRTVWSQQLDLLPEQARTIEARLWSDIKEENRYYIYHHFDDNCTTRLRDMIDEATGGKLREGSGGKHPLTFRQFGASGLAEYELLIAVSDFITGRRLDRHPTMWEAMFHPDELRLAVEDKLGAPAIVLSERKGPPHKRSGPSGRGWVVLISLLLTAPLALVRWRGMRERAALVVASLPLVFFGLALWAIFFIITIDWVRWNEAMLLFVPTDVVLPFLAPGRRRRYAQVRVGMVVLVSLLGVIGVFKQPLFVPALVAFLPLALIAFDLPPSRKPGAGVTSKQPVP
jgi:hypothetical protein